MIEIKLRRLRRVESNGAASLAVLLSTPKHEYRLGLYRYDRRSSTALLVLVDASFLLMRRRRSRDDDDDG